VGPTSFAIFTLAKCGVPAKDKGIRKGLKWLEERCRKAADQTDDRRHYLYSTYESASVILMLTALYAPDVEEDGGRQRPATGTFSRPAPGTKFDKDDWQWMHERLVHLLKGQGRYAACQNLEGGWRYWQSSGDQDLSATQFCLLALRAAARAGYPVTELSSRTYEHAAMAVQHLQSNDGAFRYQRNYTWSAGMTTAGIASLLICKEQMALAGQPVPSWIDGAVDRGLEFLGKVFDVETNPQGEETAGLERTPGYHYYYLYGIERVGALSGRKEIGGKAWYPRGAAYLLHTQDAAGFFDDPRCMRPTRTLGTCFALLFLKRATAPPAITITGD
jgi:hypothetical protein